MQKTILTASKSLLFFLSVFSYGSTFSQTDGCPGSANLTVNSSCTTSAYSVPGSFANGGLASSSCAATDKDDGWYRFVATSANTAIQATASGEAIVLAAWSGCATGELSCVNVADGATGVISIATTSGSTYYVQLHRQTGNNTAGVSGNICAYQAAAPPANNDCTGATTLTVNSALTCTSQTAGTVNAATASSQANGCSGTADDDVWYKFTATNTSHFVNINNVAGSATDMYHSVYGGTCASPGAALVCSDPNSSTVSGLTIGNVYYVRVYTYTSTPGQNSTFNVCITTPPPGPSNDDCSGATAFPVIPTNGSCSTLSNQTTTSATASGVTPSNYCTSNSGTPDDDVWFSFVATTTGLNMTSTHVSGSSSDVYWQVFSGNCGATMNSILCTDNNSGGSLSGLTIGNTYRIRLYTYWSTDNTTETICLSAPPPPPSNDDCPGATALTVNSALTCTTQTAGTIESATASSQANGCSGTADDDVWYTFVATNTAQIISLNNIIGSTSDMYFNIYGGSCASPGAALLCSDPESGTVSGLTVGNTYRVRVFTYTSSTGQTSDFSVCVTTPPPPPSNDDCPGATTVAVNPSIFCTSQTAGTIYSATQSSQANGCSGTADDDVWYKFTATNSSQYVNLNNVSGWTDMYFNVYGGSCASPGAAIICSDPNSSLVTGLTVGNVYYVRVYSYTSTTGQTATFDVCISTPPPPPANDDCPGATGLTVGTNGICSSPTAGTIASASASSQANACSGTADDDVWYTFSATATSMNVQLDNVNGSTTDLYHSVYSGACNSLGTAVVCSDPNSSSLTGLTVGHVYRVRVFSWGSTTGQTTTFDICVTPPAPPPTNSTCSAPSAYCGAPMVIPAVTGTSAQAGNNYGCLGSQPNPYWYTVTMSAAGNLVIDMNAGSDLDFAMYGPYSSTATATAACGSYPAPVACSYSASNVEQIVSPAAALGQVFVMLITNYANVSQNLNVAVNNSSTGNCGCTPLPVKLTSFHASVFGPKTVIDWTTATENNNDYFLVQRSTGGTIWETIKLQKGQAYSTSQTSYQYLDEDPLIGTSYYRLKQVDFDGNFVYSDIESVHRLSLEGFNIYPQPVVKEFRCSADAGDIEAVELVDLLGKKSSLKFNLINGEYVVNVEGYSSGIYVVSFIGKTMSYSEKIVIH